MNNSFPINVHSSPHSSLSYNKLFPINSECIENNSQPPSNQGINNNDQIYQSCEIEERDSLFHAAEPLEENGLVLLDHMDLLDQNSDQGVEASETNILERWLDGDSLLSLRSFFVSAFNDAYDITVVQDLLSHDVLGQDLSQNESKIINKCDLSKLPEINIEEETDEESLCAICIEKYTKNNVLLKLPCNHRFHKDCSKKWLLTRPACPICRKQL